MNVIINFNKTVGKIKPMHAVGQPPFTGGFAKLDFSHFEELKDAHIPYSRLHDVGGAFGSNRYVDIPNIFRNFDADVDSPEAYDFAFTDELIKALCEYGIAPYFRLGVTIENQCHIKAYHIHPPKDYDKWARICEHIIRHYNEGWANGFHFGIRYWEIWNEPENHVERGLNQMWTGTAEEYYRLYDVTAKHLKECFGDSIKVGGYASSGLYYIFSDPEKYQIDSEKLTADRYVSEKSKYRLDFFHGFLEYIKENASPIDFFSWHSYVGYKNTVIMAEYLDRKLKEYGLDVETHLNEWNNSHERVKNTLSSYASANVAAMLCAMQNTPCDMLMYYDAKFGGTGTYAGFYHPITYETTCVYEVFHAFGILFDMGNQAQALSDTDGVLTLAAAKNEKRAVIITNVSGKDERVYTNLGKDFEAYIIDEDNMMTPVDIDASNFTLKENQVILLKNS